VAVKDFAPCKLRIADVFRIGGYVLIVSEVLATKKIQDVCIVAPDTSAFDAITILTEKNLGALIVVEHDRLVGVITERDYIRKLLLKEISPRTKRVRDIMSDRVPFVTPETTINECMALMTELRIRHLPVLSSERLVGILSIGDVVKALLGEKEFLIDELVRYITNSPVKVRPRSVTGYGPRQHEESSAPDIN
jgi:CBS domain-containing protein